MVHAAALQDGREVFGEEESLELGMVRCHMKLLPVVGDEIPRFDPAVLNAVFDRFHAHRLHAAARQAQANAESVFRRLCCR